MITRMSCEGISQEIKIYTTNKLRDFTNNWPTEIDKVKDDSKDSSIRNEQKKNGSTNMRFQNILRIVKNLFMGKTLKYPSFSLFPPNAFYVPKCQDQAPFKQLYVPIPLIYPTFIINQKNIPRLNEVNNSSLCQSAIHIIYR